MDIRVVSVERQDVELFSSLDPFERLSLLNVPSGFALAAVDYEEGEASALVGLLTGFANEQSLIITWIGVTTERQGQGIGEKLLLAAFEIADEMNIGILETLISSKYEMEQIALGGIKFFEDRLFKATKQLPLEYEGTVEDLLKLDYFQKDLDKLPTPRALSSLSPTQLKLALRQIDDIEGAAKLYPVADARALVEPDLSFVYMDDGEAYEGLLVQKIEDYLLPVYFFSESDNESAALLLSSVKAAAAKYGKDTDVEIFSCSDKGLSLMQKVFPGMTHEGKKLMATIEDYRKEKRG